MIPKLSTPLAKLIRTTEGVILVASNLVLGLAALLPQGLSWTHAGLYMTIMNAASFVSRSALKIAAVNNGLGFGPPIDPLTNVPMGDVAGAETAV